MTQSYNKKIVTQGELKMNMYIQDLIRNKDFLRKMKRLKRAQKNEPFGMYDTWTEEQKKESEYFDKEFKEVLEGYEKLRKQTLKILNTPSFKIKNSISEIYNIDHSQISYIETILHKREEYLIETMKDFADLDMCKIHDFKDEEVSPSFKGREIIYIDKSRQLFLNAYPVGIFINPLASKRDVIDFIEKKWSWIENNFLRGYADKKLKYGKRKHNQKMLDFIWINRGINSKDLKNKLDEEFNGNGLVYYEISKIIQNELQKRTGY